ncbi:radical SAM family heme chaperone HemW [Tabrizicola sp. BL-A-41-H6]|uniref:radical SAM family heme chaperone HemW n=1 Tax=Tabrizicola sp. BL-A-41-H6 TaxID=3421107 RepID=UPI003D67A025
MTPENAGGKDWRSAGFGLYLHWPFCQSKCPYCDFNSHVATSIDQGDWQTAYLREIDRVAAETKGRVLNTVFFGGGTPSLMQPSLVAAILERIGQSWALANDLEVTLEANPGSVEIGRFEGYAAAGVNRVSLGIQALDDNSLRRLGRLHSSDEARRAIGIAQDVFDRVSIDLIYARQDQSLGDWERELSTALGLGTDHISLYQLTIEDGTVFQRMHAQKLLGGLPDEDLSADMFELTQGMCDAAGLPAYEVSNHAKPGAESRHNLIYWRMGDYAGIGPGAHGRLTLGDARLATEAPRSPGKWLDDVLGGRPGEMPRARLSGTEQAVEYLMMAMRLREGASLAWYGSLAGEELPAAAVAELADLGMIEVRDETMRATAQGRMVLNGVLRALLAGRQSAR